MKSIFGQSLRTFKIGDEAWIYTGGISMVKGTVAHVFTLAGWAIPEHYVIEVPTPIDPLLYVRDGLTAWYRNLDD